MARARSPSRDKAKEMYLNSNGEIRLIDIAKDLNIKDSQVRKWKSQDKWDNELKGALPIGKSNVTNKVNKKVVAKKRSECEAKEILESTELTEKQRLFCIYYIEEFNATKAYRKAYDCDYSTANTNGSRMLVNASIKTEIDRLTEDVLNEKEVSSKILLKRLLQRYIDIAFADITDYIDFGNEEAEGEFGPYTRSYVNLKNSFEVDGALISEVSQGKDGVKVKLYDKMKAMEFLSKHIGLLDIATKDKLKKEKAKLDIDKERLELEKYKTLGDDENDNNDAIQSFLKATSMSEEDVKALFDDEGDEDGAT